MTPLQYTHSPQSSSSFLDLPSPSYPCIGVACSKERYMDSPSPRGRLPLATVQQIKLHGGLNGPALHCKNPSELSFLGTLQTNNMHLNLNLSISYSCL